ncbi:hypothetical protein D3C80_449280 [compost metagenome]
MDFRKGQESVTVTAVIDEGRLKRGFDARYLGEVNIAPDLLLVLRFEIEFFDAVAAYNDYARLLFVRRVDKHFVCH